MTRESRDELARHEPLLKRLAASGTEVVIVMGPNHAEDETAHWVGALLSVTGKVSGLPTLETAVRDGLFTTGSGRYLAAFDLKKASADRIEDAQKRTHYAVRVMQARERGEAIRRPRAVMTNLPESEHPTDRARAFATNNKLKFERVYASARNAIESGDTKTALLKCKAALQLLNEELMFGPKQSELVKTITEQIEFLEQRRAS